MKRDFSAEAKEDPPGVSDETLQTYGTFLQKNLTFPIQGTYDHETGLFQTTLRPLTVLRLSEDIDEFYGIFVEGIAGKKNEVIPLADFGCDTADHRNYQLVDDYKTWFWNNR